MGDIVKNTVPQLVFGHSLHNPLGAEIHFALRDHGPASEAPELLEQPFTVGSGGCSNFGGSGEYECADIQVAIFGR